MPISGHACAQSCNDFQQGGAAGASFCSVQPQELPQFHDTNMEIFILVCKIDHLWVNFVLERVSIELFLYHTAKSLVLDGYNGILCKVQSKQGNEGRKADHNEERPFGYNWYMLRVRYQDVQDRRWWGCRR